MYKEIVIATYATKRYGYALPSVLRNIASSLFYAGIQSAKIVVVSDESPEIKDTVFKYFDKYLSSDNTAFELVHLPLDIETDGLNNYKTAAQLIICQMQTEAFCYARKINAEYFWSIESDVLVPANALRVSLDSLNYDNNYYDVCMCSYPSQGGGSFLGGRGSHNHYINEDYLPEERELPEELTNEMEARELEAKEEDFEPTEKWIARAKEIHDEIKKCPPKGNIFEVNSRMWRQRGWMDAAYPAIGKGALLPTDWVGMGCTLLSRKALSLASFDGYQGHGTQDLYLGWNFWIPNDVKLCVSTHAICDHIIRQRDGELQSYDKFTHVFAHHEHEGECVGHLRQRHVEFYNHIPGEQPLDQSDEESTDEKKSENP